MGHSLGGILIEQALINARQDKTYQKVYDATYDLIYEYFQLLTENTRTGLAFFGTPHEGGSGGMVKAGNIAANVALSVGFLTPGQVKVRLLSHDDSAVLHLQPVERLCCLRSSHHP